MAPHIKIELNERQYAELQRRAAADGAGDPALHLEEFVSRWLNRQPQSQAPQSDAMIPILLRARGGIVARASYLPDGRCIVQKGSKASLSVSSMFAKVKRHAQSREALIRNGSIVEGQSGELFEFARDVTFESVALATAVVLGYKTEGPSRWIVEGEKDGIRLNHLLAYRRIPAA